MLSKETGIYNSQPLPSQNAIFKDTSEMKLMKYCFLKGEGGPINARHYYNEKFAKSK